MVLYGYPVLILMLSAAMLTVGLQELVGGKGGHQLALWLLVSAVLMATMSVLLFTLFSLLSFSSSSSPLLLPLLFCSFLLHSLFTMVWFIIGNVWFTLTPLPASSPTAPSWRLTRTVYYALLLGYAQLAVELGVAVVGWTVRRGCLCIKRSEEGARMEDERRRLVRGEVGVGGGGPANGNAQYI